MQVRCLKSVLFQVLTATITLSLARVRAMASGLAMKMVLNIPWGSCASTSRPAESGFPGEASWLIVSSTQNPQLTRSPRPRVIVGETLLASTWRNVVVKTDSGKKMGTTGIGRNAAHTSVAPFGTPQHRASSIRQAQFIELALLATAELIDFR